MADEKKSFLLRIHADTHAALERWAADDLRSVNAQIEFLLKDALRRAGRTPNGRSGDRGGAGPGGEAR